MEGTASELKQDSKRESLLPVGQEGRIFGLSTYIPFWISSMVVIQLFIAGQTFVPPNGKLNLFQAIIAAIASAVIIGLMFIINSQPGMKYGIPFIVQARSSFGYNGARIASTIRVIPALFWYGIGTWIGAEAISYITDVFWGWSSTPIYFIAFMIFQTILAYYGIQVAKWFNVILSTIVIGFLIYINYKFLTVGTIEISSSWQTEGSWGLPFYSAVAAAVAVLITGSINNGDLSRYLHNRVSYNWIGHLVGIVPAVLLLIFTGILAAAVTGIWDPIQALVAVVDNQGIAILMLVFIVGAQITTNLTLNIIPPAIVIMEIFNIKWGTSTIIVGIIGSVTFPWVLLTHEGFNAFLGYYAAFLGPLLGILITDYYFVRKRKFDLEKLYETKVKYHWLGLGSLIIGGIVGMIFLSISWMVSLPLSVLIYWLGYQVIPYYKAEINNQTDKSIQNIGDIEA